ncbi:MAG: phage shock protein PspA [Deltaproteobacteria bacterium]|nr:phage shock protein PspA [Deltaproteobacteria bacterium]
MGIFTRFRDIVSSNINSMLDKAEDPEKMLKLMIREMEDTLIEIKSACAGVMAAGKRIERELEGTRSRVEYWQGKAALAVSKGRDDLARDALVEKRRYTEKAESLQRELKEHQVLVAQYQDDMVQLEQKLGGAREKQRTLVQRHIHARRQKQAQEEIRRIENSEAIFKFEEFENRIERMEAEADLVNFGRNKTTEQELDALIVDEDIENELQNIKSSLSKDSQQMTQS